MKLVVVIPCLNEAATIAGVLRRIPRSISGVEKIITVVVDDGSTDQTAKLARDNGATVVSHPNTRGVGAALHSGLEEALRLGADIITNVDGDGQFDAADIPKIIHPILQGRADFATASRFADPALTPDMPRVKILGNHAMSWLISSLAGQRFHDVSCGFRAYSRDAALNLNLMGQFTYTQETFLSFAFKGYRIVEVPLQVRGEREFGESRVAGNLLYYTAKSAKIIFRCYRDYHPLRFFGSLALWFGLAGTALLAFFFWHYLRTGAFSGHLWAGFSGSALAFVGLVLFVVGMVADMLDRVRANQEKILYQLKLLGLKQTFQRPSGPRDAGGRRPRKPAPE